MLVILLLLQALKSLYYAMNLQALALFLVCLKTVVFEADFCFTVDVFLFIYLFCHGISELRQLISAKFCTLISSLPNFEN